MAPRSIIRCSLVCGVALLLLLACTSRVPAQSTYGLKDTTAVDSATGAPPAARSPRATGRAPQDTVKMAHGVPLSKSPSGALIRSIAVPGWGQLYVDRPYKALVFFGVNVGMVYGAVFQHVQFLDYVDKADSVTPDDPDDPQSVEQARRLSEFYEDTANFYRDDRNRLIWWSAGVILLASLDAYVEAHLYDFRIDPTIGTTPQGDGPSVGISITLP